MFGFKRRRRERLKKQAFPPEWLKIIERNVPYYLTLTPAEQQELQGHVQVFLHEKRFDGAGGLAITDEIRLTIAAQACVLLLHRETDYYPDLYSIVVYPHHYFAEKTVRNPDGTVSEGMEARLGESWHRGEVVLSWNDVLHGAHDPHDGRNVVFHEFAHQLDSEDGTVDGAPKMPKHSMYLPWARVLTKEYKQLIEDLEHHRRTCLDNYAATNPPEFFAVVTEMFFENPYRLKKCHPELYEQIKGFYRQDPASRTRKAKK